MSILPVPHNSFEVDFGTPFDKKTIQVTLFNTPSWDINKNGVTYSVYIFQSRYYRKIWSMFIGFFQTFI